MSLDWPGPHQVTDPTLVRVLTLGTLAGRGAGPWRRAGGGPGPWAAGHSTGGRGASAALGHPRVSAPGLCFSRAAGCRALQHPRRQDE